MAAGRENEKGTPGSCVPWHPDQREDSLLGRLILGILILVASIRLLVWLPSGFNEPPLKNTFSGGINRQRLLFRNTGGCWIMGSPTTALLQRRRCRDL